MPHTLSMFGGGLSPVASTGMSSYLSKLIPVLSAQNSSLSTNNRTCPCTQQCYYCHRIHCQLKKLPTHTVKVQTEESTHAYSKGANRVSFAPKANTTVIHFISISIIKSTPSPMSVNLSCCCRRHECRFKLYC